jgi:hypothetical protein
MDHVTDWSQDNLESISGTFQLREWYEIDDVVHAYGPLFSPNLNLTVTDENETTILDSDFDENSGAKGLLGNVMIREIGEYNVVTSDDPDYYFFAHSSEKGSFVYEISDESFDPSKLVLEITTVVEDFRIITRVLYDGKELDLYDSSTRGVVFSCAIITGKHASPVADSIERD